MQPPLRVGDVFCGGYFGRDSHEDKRIEAVGSDWIVCRPVDRGIPVFADFSGSPNEYLLEFRRRRS